MSSNLELRFATALRSKIQEELGSYIANLDCIPVGDPTVIAMRFIEERSRFNVFEEVLALIDEVQDELSK